MQYRIGSFEIDLSRRLVVAGDRRLPIGSRAFDVLAALVERRGALVTKGELLDAVWPGLVVEEANIHVQVSALRRHLGADSIATVPGLGYRLSLPFDEAQQRSPAAPRAALSIEPESLDVLVGREEDLAQLEPILMAHRIVTLHGPGGIGKTRLARELLQRHLAAGRSAACWVDIATVRDEGALAVAVARAAGVPLADRSGAPFEELARALAECRLLLVLDNAESLVRGAAALAQGLAQRVPGLRILVTSQEPMHCAGEQVYRVAPLTVPDPADAAHRQRASPAFRLLLQRAQQLDRRFQVPDTELGRTVHLLRQLDGLPLAIEMAAGYLPTLGVAGVTARQDDLRDAHGHRQRAVSPRHQTLRATLSWSFELLDEQHRGALRRLSAFAGEFGLTQAQQLLQQDGQPSWQALEVLATLVDKALVQVERHEPPRYRLLETMRQFAREELVRAGQAAAADALHGRVMAKRALEVEQSFWHLPDDDFLAAADSDYAEFDVAFERACARGDVSVASACGLILMRQDQLRSVNAARRRRARMIFDLLPHAGPLDRALGWTQLASHGLISLDFADSLEVAARAVAAWREVGDMQRLAFALGFHASQCARVERWSDADALMAEARSLERPDWPFRLRMWLSSAPAGIAIHRGDAQAYWDHTQRELALAEAGGARRTAAWARLKLADAALMAGRCTEAIALGETAVQALRSLNQPSNFGLALANLAAAHALAGHDDDAREAAREAIAPMCANGWGYLVFDTVALLAARRGRHEEAARLLAHVDDWYGRHADRRQPNEHTVARATEAQLDAVLTPAAWQVLREAGAALGDDAARQLAQSLLA